MIEATSDAILVRLGEIAAARTVDEWVGDIDDLLKQPSKLLPALFLIYGGCKFAAQAVIGAPLAPQAEGWTVVVMGRSLRSRTDGAASCYALIEAVRAKLIGWDTGNGHLWPSEETLLAAHKSTLVYGLNYITKTETEGADD